MVRSFAPFSGETGELRLTDDQYATSLHTQATSNGTPLFFRRCLYEHSFPGGEAPHRIGFCGVALFTANR
jgi:hypothetical protein